MMMINKISIFDLMYKDLSHYSAPLLCSYVESDRYSPGHHPHWSGSRLPNLVKLVVALISPNILLVEVLKEDFRGAG